VLLRKEQVSGCFSSKNPLHVIFIFNSFSSSLKLPAFLIHPTYECLPRNLSLMKTNVLLLTVLSFLSLNVFAQLREQYNGSNKNSHIDALSFLSPSTGFVAFDTHIGFTSDSSKTFTQRYISVNNTNTNGFNMSLYGGFTPASIKAFSADSVLVGGDVTTEPTILFSHDGGLS
jgi:hypothetical protein